MADCSQPQPKKWTVEAASLNLIKKELEIHYLLFKFHGHSTNGKHCKCGGGRHGTEKAAGIICSMKPTETGIEVRS